MADKPLAKLVGRLPEAASRWASRGGRNVRIVESGTYSIQART
jgi:hypothetical protein